MIVFFQRIGWKPLPTVDECGYLSQQSQLFKTIFFYRRPAVRENSQAGRIYDESSGIDKSGRGIFPFWFFYESDDLIFVPIWLPRNFPHLHDV